MKRASFKKPNSFFIIQGQKIPFSKGKFMLFSNVYDKSREDIIEIKDPEINVDAVKIFADSIKGKEFIVQPELIEPLYKLSRQWQYNEMIEYLDNIMSVPFLIERITEKIVSNKDTQKYEQILSTRIDEAIKDAKFHELPTSNLLKIFQLANGIDDHNELLKFILNEIEQNGDESYPLLNYIDLRKLNNSSLQQVVDLIKSTSNAKNYIKIDETFIEHFLNYKKTIDEENNKLHQMLNSTVDELTKLKNDSKNIVSLSEKLKEKEYELEKVKSELITLKDKLQVYDQRHISLFFISSFSWCLRNFN